MATGTASLTVRRGEKSWNYIYIALAFAITFEGTVIQMIPTDVLRFPWNVVTYLGVGIATGYLFLECGWLQNKLLGWKSRYEDKDR